MVFANPARCSKAICFWNDRSWPSASDVRCHVPHGKLRAPVRGSVARKLAARFREFRRLPSVATGGGWGVWPNKAPERDDGGAFFCLGGGYVNSGCSTGAVGPGHLFPTRLALGCARRQGLCEATQDVLIRRCRFPSGAGVASPAERKAARALATEPTNATAVPILVSKNEIAPASGRLRAEFGSSSVEFASNFAKAGPSLAELGPNLVDVAPHLWSDPPTPGQSRLKLFEVGPVPTNTNGISPRPHQSQGDVDRSLPKVHFQEKSEHSTRMKIDPQGHGKSEAELAMLLPSRIG